MSLRIGPPATSSRGAPLSSSSSSSSSRGARMPTSSSLSSSSSSRGARTPTPSLSSSSPRGAQMLFASGIKFAVITFNLGDARDVESATWETEFGGKFWKANFFDKVRDGNTVVVLSTQEDGFRSEFVDAFDRVLTAGTRENGRSFRTARHSIPIPFFSVHLYVAVPEGGGLEFPPDASGSMLHGKITKMTVHIDVQDRNARRFRIAGSHMPIRDDYTDTQERDAAFAKVYYASLAKKTHFCSWAT